MIASCKNNAYRHHGMVSLIVMSVSLSMDMYNHLQGIKSDLRNVVKFDGEKTIVFHVEVLLRGPDNEFPNA